jgi:type I restriction enzyme S subunit
MAKEQSFRFALPPLAGQARIVTQIERRLSVLDELQGVVSANIQRATRIRQSILQQAFSGNLQPERGPTSHDDI